jgi:hypothetical protein
MLMLLVVVVRQQQLLLLVHERWLSMRDPAPATRTCWHRRPWARLLG